MSKIIIGGLKVFGLPEELCFESLEQFISDLPNILRVEIPDSGLSNVIISNEQPGSDDKGALWIRRANSGEVIGAYIFSTDRWVQLFPAPSQIFVLTGSSDAPPAGYRALLTGDYGLTSGQVADIYTKLALVTTTAGIYYVYPAIFIGV